MSNRPSFSAGVGLPLAAGATTWVAMSSWRGFTERPVEFLPPLLLVAATVALSGALGRWVRAPGAVVFLGQALLGFMMVSWVVVGSPFPVGATWTELVDTFDAALDSANTYAAPVPANVPPVHPLLIAGGLGAMLLVDLLACTLRRVPLAGLPLLAVYSLPVSLLESSISWGVFLLTAIGFLAMLFLHETSQISRWGRPLTNEATDSDITVFGNPASLRASAGRIGGVATALAVVVPIAIPTLTLDVFDFGIGDGGDSEIKIENPITDMRRDLKRGTDYPLLTVTTDDPDPDYLRISVLNRFSDEEWSSGDRDVPDENRADGPVPPPPGLGPSVEREEFDYEVDVTDDFKSKWLPTQPLISSIVAEGDWRFDATTMDFISSEDDLRTTGLSYDFESIEVDLEARGLAAMSTQSDEVPGELTETPDDLPPLVEKLAFEVTDGQPTEFEEAVALQQWFREAGGFEYDLENSPTGSGVDDLTSFLSEDGRVGYCEQFATAMAVMARVLDIPARVAVGFLSPDDLGGGRYEYSTHDLHAWPELYFEGAGWVRFEPTPAEQAPDTPEYTQQNLNVGNPNVPPDNPTPSGPASRPAEPAPEAPEPEPADLQETDTTEESGFPWLPVGGGLVGLLLVGAVVMGPRGVRRSRREQRLGSGPEAAWQELWATAVDLRLDWPDGRSPQETQRWMTEQFGTPDADDIERPRRGEGVAPQAEQALDRIVREIELLRYSRRGNDTPGALREDVLTCVDALRAGVAPPTRRRADWWPRSVLRRQRSAAGRQREQARVGGLVEHI